MTANITRKDYENFCKANDTEMVITLNSDYGEPEFVAVSDGEWHDYCVKTASNLVEMDWTPEEREDWEEEYGIYGFTADRIEEYMRERIEELKEQEEN
jgi:hypothetical protein